MRRTKLRDHRVGSHDVYRTEVPAFSTRAWSDAGKGDPVPYERLANPTGSVPAEEIEQFLAGRQGFLRGYTVEKVKYFTARVDDHTSKVAGSSMSHQRTVRPAGDA